MCFRGDAREDDKGCVRIDKIRNPNIEIRNKFKILMTKILNNGSRQKNISGEISGF